MATLQIEYHVPDVDEWKRVFDRDPMNRRSHGVTGHSIFQNTDDAGHLLVAFEFGSTDEARAFREVLRPVWEMSGAARSWILD